jgi:hypothetical protein
MIEMSKLYDLQELVDKTGLPERTVRYYLAKVLDAPGGTRGRKAFYPQETLDQLKLAKQILMAPYDPKRGEVKPSLRDFQRWLQSHTAEEIRAMAEMPYRIKPKSLLAASAPHVSEMRSEEQAMHSLERSKPLSRPLGKEDDKNTKDTAAQYLNRVMGTSQGAQAAPDNRHRRSIPWQSFQFGDDLEIKIRKRLTPAQKQQLALAGQLLQSMLEKE